MQTNQVSERGNNEMCRRAGPFFRAFAAGGCMRLPSVLNDLNRLYGVVNRVFINIIYWLYSSSGWYKRLYATTDKTPYNSDNMSDNILVWCVWARAATRLPLAATRRRVDWPENTIRSSKEAAIGSIWSIYIIWLLLVSGGTVWLSHYR